jgi:excinuclease ABC subunit C
VVVFLFENGRLRGPAAFSTLGMRIQNEQSGSTSLFAQPMAIEPVPEKQGTENREQGTENEGAEFNTGSLAEDLKGHDFSRANIGQQSEGALAPEGTFAAAHETGIAHAAKLPRGLLESRLEAAIAELSATSAPTSAAVRQGHLALLKRWYYRPEARRTGEIFFPDAEDRWPAKAILRGIGRVAAKSLPSAP